MPSGMLTPADPWSWSCPIWDMHILYLLRLTIFPKLLIFHTLHFEDYSALSWFNFVDVHRMLKCCMYFIYNLLNLFQFVSSTKHVIFPSYHWNSETFILRQVNPVYVFIIYYVIKMQKKWNIPEHRKRCIIRPSWIF